MSKSSVCPLRTRVKGGYPGGYLATQCDKNNTRGKHQVPGHTRCAGTYPKPRGEGM